MCNEYTFCHKSDTESGLLCRMALSDAKGDVDDRVRDLAAAERELEKADFDLRYKTHEAKIVNKAAVAKRTEVGEVPPPSADIACRYSASSQLFNSHCVG